MKVSTFKQMFLAAMLALVAACGSKNETIIRTVPSQQDQEMKDQMLKLQDQINSVLISDFKTCTSVGIETSDLLIRNVCKIAQAATVEARVELKGQLGELISQLQDQVEADRIDIVSYQSSITSLNNTLTNLQVAIATNLESVDIADDTSLAGYGPFFESILRANDRSKINSFSNSMTSISVGSNPLRVHGNTTVTATVATDMVNLTAHLLSNGAPVKFTTSNTLPAPLSTSTTYYVVNASANTFQVSTTVGGSAVDITSTGSGTHRLTSQQIFITTSGAHGLLVGNTINLTGFAAGVGGLLAGDVTGDFLVASVPTTSTLTIHIIDFSTTSSTSMGGSLGSLQKVLGRGMSTAWQTASDEQLKVSSGTRNYNFLITGASTVFTANPAVNPTGWGGFAAPGAGFVCWKIDNASASAAQIKAGGATVTCR